MSSFREISKFRTCATHHGISFVGALLATMRLYCFGQFSLKEIIGYALYAPKVRLSVPVLISKEASLAKLARINSHGQQHQTEDKSVFYAKCQGVALPVPVTYGVFEGGRGTDRFGQTLDGREPWVRYFKSALPECFIVKEREGAYGSGFAAFERESSGFRRVGQARTGDCDWLYDELIGQVPISLVIQERFFDHPDLEVLSGCKGLQTLRVNTYLEEDGSVSILFYMLKVLVGTNVSDNFSMGTKGNLIGIGDPQIGVLTGARTLHPSGSGLISIDRHPVTGIPFRGFRIPLWSEAIDLAKKAHRFFPEFGALGWDIALTSDGPKLIEANAWWDPPLYAPEIMSNENWRRLFA